MVLTIFFHFLFRGRRTSVSLEIVHFMTNKNRALKRNNDSLRLKKWIFLEQVSFFSLLSRERKRILTSCVLIGKQGHLEGIMGIAATLPETILWRNIPGINLPLMQSLGSLIKWSLNVCLVFNKMWERTLIGSFSGHDHFLLWITFQSASAWATIYLLLGWTLKQTQKNSQFSKISRRCWFQHFVHGARLHVRVPKPEGCCRAQEPRYVLMFECEKDPCPKRRTSHLILVHPTALNSTEILVEITLNISVVLPRSVS